MTIRCPAVLLSAPASGQGKTSATAAWARSEVRRGRRVRVFKTGPDFIDPMVLECASGRPVYQLDLFMGGEEHCRSLLYRAAAQSDLLLVEGAMGLFDGAPSSADLAATFELPIVAVIDASAMAQTFGAVAHGLSTFRADVGVTGVIANRVAGSGHAAMVEASLPAGIRMVAGIPFDPTLAVPERHLGLVQASELVGLNAQVDRLADAWEQGGGSGFRPDPVSFREAADGATKSRARSLGGVRIAVANDIAFSFIYEANLDLLRDLGAEIVMFSPLADTTLPACDALWLPGGYPELHARQLESNHSMRAALRAHHARGRPIVAECGGALYLLDGLTLGSSGAAVGGGTRHAMVGVLPGEAQMHTRLSAIGLQLVRLPEGELRGHSFHFSSLVSPLPPVSLARCPNGGRTAEPVYRFGSATASYMHFYFPSNPDAVCRLFRPPGTVAFGCTGLSPVRQLA